MYICDLTKIQTRQKVTRQKVTRQKVKQANRNILFLQEQVVECRLGLSAPTYIASVDYASYQVMS